MIVKAIEPECTAVVLEEFPREGVAAFDLWTGSANRGASCCLLRLETEVKSAIF